MKLSPIYLFIMILLLVTVFCFIEGKDDYYQPKMNRMMRVGRAGPTNIRGYKKMSIFPRVGRSETILDEEKEPLFTLTLLNYDKPDTENELEAIAERYGNEE